MRLSLRMAACICAAIGAMMLTVGVSGARADTQPQGVFVHHNWPAVPAPGLTSISFTQTIRTLGDRTATTNLENDFQSEAPGEPTLGFTLSFDGTGEGSAQGYVDLPGETNQQGGDFVDVKFVAGHTYTSTAKITPNGDSTSTLTATLTDDTTGAITQLGSGTIPSSDAGFKPQSNDFELWTGSADCAHLGQVNVESAPDTGTGVGTTYSIVPVAAGAMDDGFSDCSYPSVLSAQLNNGEAIVGWPNPTYRIAITAANGGYDMASSDGSVFSFGTSWYGSEGNESLSQPVVGMAATPDGGGYWEVAADGGVFAFGDAGFYGSATNLKLTKPVVGITPTPDGKGYWLVAADGGVFNYGDAKFYGSAGNLNLTKPVVGITATPDGKGYWLVAGDGGVFNYGDAGFYGSAGNLKLTKPVVGIARTQDGKGYWLVGADGGIFNYGDATFYGSESGKIDHPIVGIAPTPDGKGYWLASSYGEIYFLGDATNQGSDF